MKCAIGEDRKYLNQCMASGSFQITQEENGFRASISLKSVLVGQKRRFSLLMGEACRV